MAVLANNIIVHKVQKYQQQKADPVRYREVLLPVRNDEEDTTYKFIQAFSRIYKNHRKTSRTFGEFEEDQVVYPVSGLVQQYIQGSIDFLDLSKKIADQFRARITDIPMATGGYIFCIDYEDEGEACFAIVILTNKTDTSIDDETLDLLTSFSLDIDDINMAVNIKINKWQQGESSYLSFIRGLKDVSTYFRTFVGCKPTESNAAITKKVIDSVHHFIELEYGEEAFMDKKEEASQTMFDLMRSNPQSLSLRTVANTVFPEEGIQGRFYGFLDSNDIEITYDFIPDKRVFRGLMRFEYKTKKIDLKIDRAAFNDGLAVFEEETNYLIIKDPLIKQRHDELK